MTYDVIDLLVRPANPVPDPKLLEAVDVTPLDSQRREEMQGQQVEVDRVDQTPGRGPLIGIAAAILVLLIGGVAVFQAIDDSDVAAERTPAEVANEYVAAYGAFDVEKVGSMLAEEAVVLPWEAYEPRDWRNDLRYLEAAGFHLNFDDCVQFVSESSAVTVHCEYVASGLGSDQIGLDPFPFHVFRLTIEDGLVTSSDMGFDFSQFSTTMWYPFQSWIQSSHPEDFSVLYVNEGLSRQTDEAIALWEERVQDYVEYVNSQS